jgi:hypothetical protein
MAALFRYSLTTLFSLAATEVTAQMVVLANQGDELAQHWVGRVVKRKEPVRALLLEAVEAAGTVGRIRFSVFEAGCINSRD